LEDGSLEVSSSEVSSSEVSFMKIETGTVFLGYASIRASEHIQDRLDVSGRLGGSRSFRSVPPNVSRKDFHNRAVVPFRRVPSDPFERIDTTKAYSSLGSPVVSSVAPSWSIARVKRSVIWPCSVRSRVLWVFSCVCAWLSRACLRLRHVKKRPTKPTAPASPTAAACATEAMPCTKALRSAMESLLSGSKYHMSPVTRPTTPSSSIRMNTRTNTVARATSTTVGRQPKVLTSRSHLSRSHTI
jgi:hypothetical protein